MVVSDYKVQYHSIDPYKEIGIYIAEIQIIIRGYQTKNRSQYRIGVEGMYHICNNHHKVVDVGMYGNG